MRIQHRKLASGQWKEMFICEQMANIGSEVSRALNWQKKGNNEFSRKAINRALELIDLSLDSLKSFPQLREMARVREVLVDYFYGDNQFSSSEILWRKYFDHFQYALRKNY